MLPCGCHQQPLSGYPTQQSACHNWTCGHTVQQQHTAKRTRQHAVNFMMHNFSQGRCYAPAEVARTVLWPCCKWPKMSQKQSSLLPCNWLSSAPDPQCVNLAAAVAARQRPIPCHHHPHTACDYSQPFFWLLPTLLQDLLPTLLPTLLKIPARYPAVNPGLTCSSCTGTSTASSAGSALTADHAARCNPCGWSSSDR